MEKLGILNKLFRLVKTCLKMTKISFKIEGDYSDSFMTKNRHFASHLIQYSVWKNRKNCETKSPRVLAVRSQKLCFVYGNDIDLIGQNTISMTKVFKHIDDEARRIGLRITQHKTKYMHLNRNKMRENASNYNFAHVQEIKYLDVVITSENNVRIRNKHCARK